MNVTMKIKLFRAEEAWKEDTQDSKQFLEVVWSYHENVSILSLEP